MADARVIVEAWGKRVVKRAERDWVFLLLSAEGVVVVVVVVVTVVVVVVVMAVAVAEAEAMVLLVMVLSMLLLLLARVSELLVDSDPCSSLEDKAVAAADAAAPPAKASRSTAI